MSISDDQQFIDQRREQLDLYEVALRAAVRDSCPGEHKVRNHRDMRSPWCTHCGRTDRGESVKHVDQ